MKLSGKNVCTYFCFVFFMVSLLYALLINLNYWMCIILGGFVIFIIGNVMYAKKLKRFRYIYKINDSVLQMKELEFYKEKGGKLDYLYYNTLSNVQMYSLDFEGAAISNEMMFGKLKHPRIGERLIYENNKCLLLNYMKKYKELAELIVVYEESINESKHTYKTQYCMRNLLISKLRLALVDKNIVSAKKLLEEYKNILPVEPGQAYVVDLYQAEIDYIEGDLENAKGLINNIISTCDHKPLISQAEDLKKIIKEQIL